MIDALARARLVGLTFALTAALIVTAFFAKDVATQITALYPLAANGAYFHPEHFLLLYVLWPLTAVAVCVAFLAPGLALALGLGTADRAPKWLGTAFLISLAASVVAVTVGKIAGRPLSTTVLLRIWALMTAAALAWSAKRPLVPIPRMAPEDRRRLVTWAGLVFVLAAVLVPKLFWSDLTSDGVEAFEFERSLHSTWLPSFEVAGDRYGFYIKFFLFSYPGHWFQQTLGFVEVGARLPFLLYGIMLIPTVALIAESGTARALTAAEEATLAAGVLLYMFVQAYTSTYEPYLTDLAEPSATDTLWILLFLLATWALFTGRQMLFIVVALANFGSSPGGTLLLLALVGVLVVFPPAEGRGRLRPVIVVLAIATVLAALHWLIVVRGMMDGAKNQFDGGNLLSRLVPPDPFQFHRFAFLILPCGIVPAVWMIFVRKRALVPWLLTGVCVAYFLVIYAQSWAGIHQFTPVMILPLVVFWRMRLTNAAPRAPLPVVWAGIAVAAFLSTPKHFEISQGARTVGLATDYRVGDYHASLESAGAARVLYFDVLREDYRICYPEQPWGADAFALVHYANRDKPPGNEINYVVQTKTASAPPGFSHLATRGDHTVYVKDHAKWQQHRNPDFPREVVPAVYDGVLSQSFAFFRGIAGWTLDGPPCVETSTTTSADGSPKP